MQTSEWAADLVCVDDIKVNDHTYLECGFSGVVEPTHIERTLLGDYELTFECPRCGATYTERA